MINNNSFENGGSACQLNSAPNLWSALGSPPDVVNGTNCLTNVCSYPNVASNGNNFVHLSNSEGIFIPLNCTFEGNINYMLSFNYMLCNTDPSMEQQTVVVDFSNVIPTGGVPDFYSDNNYLFPIQQVSSGISLWEANNWQNHTICFQLNTNDESAFIDTQLFLLFGLNGNATANTEFYIDNVVVQTCITDFNLETTICAGTDYNDLLQLINLPAGVIINDIAITGNGVQGDGNGNFDFTWSNVLNPAIVDFNINLVLTGTDALGCPVFGTGVLHIDYTNNSPFVYLVQPACIGQCNGIMNTTAVSIIYPIGPNMDALCAGLYQVFAIDGVTNCLSLPTPFTIPEIDCCPPTTLTAITTSPTCDGLADATADITIIGGTAPYNNIVWTGPTNATGADQTNLTDGTYNITFNDANNCPGTGTVVIEQGPVCCDINPNPPLDYTIEAGPQVWWNNAAQDYVLTEDLILEDGAVLYIIGRNIRIAGGKKILVNPGAALHLTNSTLTKIQGCGMWKGIECSARYKVGIPYTSVRGLLRSINSHIEYAEKAFSNFRSAANGNALQQCVDEFGNLVTGNCSQHWKEGIGGTIMSTEDFYLNNKYDAHFKSFKRRNGFAPYSYAADGSSYFGCHFLIDNDYETGHLPEDRIFMDNVLYVRFRGCDFKNTVPAYCQIANKPLVAIRAYVASFMLKGYCNDNTCNTSLDGFAYGVYQVGGTNQFATQIDKVTFNCFRGIFSLFPRRINVHRNWFEDYNFNVAPVIHTTQYATQAFGCYIQGSISKFDIRENHFNLDNFPRVGCVVNDCGNWNNTVYGNVFNNQPLGLGLYNRNRNSNGLSGLLYQCNTFNSLAAIDVFSFSAFGGVWSGINLNQKYVDPNSLDIESAGNQFLNPGGNWWWHEHAENFTNTYNYYAANSDVYDPSEFGGVFIMDDQLFNACDDYVNLVPDNEQRIADLELEIEVQTAIRQMIVDGGDTEGLTAEVLYASYSEALQLYNTLINQSPALSEEVMLYTIEREFPLPSVLLTQLLAANPTAAKSALIRKALADQTTPLNEMQMNQINAGLNILSTKEVYEAKISSLQAQRELALHRIMDNIEADLEHPDPMGAKLALFANPVSINDVYTKATLLIATEEYEGAIDLLEQAPSQFDMTRPEEDEIVDLVYLIELEESQPGSITNAQEAILIAIVDNSGPWASSWAESKLIELGLRELFNPIYTPDDVPPNLRSALVSGGSIVSNEITCFPNPASNFVVITAASSSITAIRVKDTVGKLLVIQDYFANSNQQVIDIGHLAIGCYNIEVSTIDGSTHTLQIIKE